MWLSQWLLFGVSWIQMSPKREVYDDSVCLTVGAISGSPLTVDASPGFPEEEEGRRPPEPLIMST